MNIGGVEKSLLSLLSLFPKNDYNISVLLLENRGAFLDHIPSWIKVDEAQWFREIKPLIMQTPQQTVKYYYKKRKYIKITSFLGVYLFSKHFNNRYIYYKYIFKDVPENLEIYDVAIAYQGPTDAIDYYIVNKVKAKKKISWVHFDVSKHLINEELYKKLYQGFEKIYVVSNEAKKHLVEKIPTVERKAEVFLNIVPHDLINRLSMEKVEFDEDYKGMKIVTVGRLSKEKGQDLAIKTLWMLRKNGYDVRWYCIGEGNSRKEYEELIKSYDLKDDFILLGAKHNPYPYIRRADIYVQTSRHEGYCLTLSEAKCLSKPIVTTNFIGAYEQIEEGTNGYIVGCNIEELYKKIEYLIIHPEKQEEFRSKLSSYSEKITYNAEKLVRLTK